MENTAVIEAPRLTAHDEPPEAPPAEPPLIPPEESPPEEVLGTEYPRAASSSRRRVSAAAFPLIAASVGVVAGALYAALSPADTDFSACYICDCSGGFMAICGRRLLWGGAFLLTEYLCGFFALGSLFVWLVPLLCGLGTGASAAAAFITGTGGALQLVIPSVMCAVTVSVAAGTSAVMSDRLLRTVSSAKDSIVVSSPAAGEYSLKFAGYLAAVFASGLIEAVIKALC